MLNSYKTAHLDQNEDSKMSWTSKESRRKNAQANDLFISTKSKAELRKK